MKKQKNIIPLLAVLLVILFTVLALLIFFVFFDHSNSNKEDPRLTASVPMNLPEEGSGIENETEVFTDPVPSESEEAGRKEEEQIVSLGDPLTAIAEKVEQLHGTETDISVNGLDYDGWLHLFKTDSLLLLCHFNEADEVDMFAVYEGEALTSYGGTEPVSMDVFIRFDPEKSSFPEYVGYWGENFSEDEYVYFMDTPNVILYDTTEQTANAVPLF